VHSQLFGRLALVTPVRCQHFAQILPFELSHRIIIANAAGVHLRNKAVQFSSHFNPLLIYFATFGHMKALKIN
jgi:hypothetical protein